MASLQLKQLLLVKQCTSIRLSVTCIAGKMKVMLFKYKGINIIINSTITLTACGSDVFVKVTFSFCSGYMYL